MLGSILIDECGKALRIAGAVGSMAWCVQTGQAHTHNFASPEDFASNYRLYRDKWAQETNGTGDLVAILEALKQAGSLKAEMVVI